MVGESSFVDRAARIVQFELSLGRSMLIVVIPLDFVTSSAVVWAWVTQKRRGTCSC